MRVHLIFIVLAVTAFLFGIGLLTASAGQVTNAAYQLPVGRSYCAYLGFDTATGGSLDVAFNVTTGTVAEYVMTSAQYDAFFAGGSPFSLAWAMGARGTFSGSLPSAGTYYLVICHGPGYENTAQTGLTTVTVNAVSAAPFYAGIGGIVLGVVFSVVAFSLQRRPAKPAPPTPSVPPAPAGFGTIVLSLENAGTAEETVQIVMNGLAVGSVPVPAGQTIQATLHPALTNPYGSPVRIEAVMADGRRALQDLTATAYRGASMKLRIHPPTEGTTPPGLTGGPPG